ncbi:hypothetical protein CF336_g6577 [Tilletia laevis]|nr:hypothetical protein CF336_g6577 [Tilletia laevis]
MAARTSRNAAPHPSRAQPDRIQLLKDKCIVDQAKGSAQLAALSGGRRVEKVIARLEEEASAKTQDSIDIVEYLTSMPPTPTCNKQLSASPIPTSTRQSTNLKHANPAILHIPMGSALRQLNTAADQKHLEP